MKTTTPKKYVVADKLETLAKRFSDLGIARFKCNKCGKVVERRLGWKLWTKSFCRSTGQEARLYRISAPEIGLKKEIKKGYS